MNAQASSGQPVDIRLTINEEQVAPGGTVSFSVNVTANERISGVALARLLAADGHRVTVLEKSERAGGLCKSRPYGEFTFDEAGGHILFSKNKTVLQWQLDRCGGDAGTVRTERNTQH